MSSGWRIDRLLQVRRARSGFKICFEAAQLSLQLAGRRVGLNLGGLLTVKPVARAGLGLDLSVTAQHWPHQG
jgi:hypothetical protein